MSCRTFFFRYVYWIFFSTTKKAKIMNIIHCFVHQLEYFTSMEKSFMSPGTCYTHTHIMYHQLQKDENSYGKICIILADQMAFWWEITIPENCTIEAIASGFVLFVSDLFVMLFCENKKLRNALCTDQKMSFLIKLLKLWEFSRFFFSFLFPSVSAMMIDILFSLALWLRYSLGRHRFCTIFFCSRIHWPTVKLRPIVVLAYCLRMQFVGVLVWIFD